MKPRTLIGKTLMGMFNIQVNAQTYDAICNRLAQDVPQMPVGQHFLLSNLPYWKIITWLKPWIDPGQLGQRMWAQVGAGHYPGIQRVMTPIVNGRNHHMYYRV